MTWQRNSISAQRRAQCAPPRANLATGWPFLLPSLGARANRHDACRKAGWIRLARSPTRQTTRLSSRATVQARRPIHATFPGASHLASQANGPETRQRKTGGNGPAGIPGNGRVARRGRSILQEVDPAGKAIPGNTRNPSLNPRTGTEMAQRRIFGEFYGVKNLRKSLIIKVAHPIGVEPITF
jgi:hypothetical protein